MKLMGWKKKLSWKKKSKAPLSAQAAIAAGGLLLTWGYRRWNRKKVDHSRSADVQAKAERLAGKFHSLDQEAHGGHIPKDLEREPKNLEQSTHPG